jgi:hypothetical protein
VRPQDPALRSLGYETEVDGKRESGCPAQEHRGGSARAEASRGARQRNPLRRINDTLAKGPELVKRAKGSNTKARLHHHHCAAAIAHAGAAPTAAEADRAWRLLPAWLYVIGIVLCAIAGRAGRDPTAAERNLPARMDAQW